MSKIDVKLLESAIETLKKFENNKNEGTSVESKVSLFKQFPSSIIITLTLNKQFEDQRQTPIKIPLPNGIFFPSSSEADLEHSICLFVKSDEKQSIEDQLTTQPFDGLDKVLSLSQVLKNYHEFKHRKQLLKEHTHFLCDERIAGHLYDALGNVFSKQNNYPIPINCNNLSAINDKIDSAVQSTHFFRRGKAIAIKVGYVCMSTNQIVDNVISALDAAIEKLPEQWDRVIAIHAKTSYSPSIPLYGKQADEAIAFIKEHESKAVTNNSSNNAKSKITKKRKVTDSHLGNKTDSQAGA
eukprot:gene19075-24900_t